MKHSLFLLALCRWFLRFKSELLLIGLFSISIAVAYPQTVAEYGFKDYQGNFTPLVGGMSNNFQGTLDEGAWQNLLIGFNFSYEGVMYTTASASTNGFVRL